MACLTPITLKKKEVAIDDPFSSNVVPCGKCPACLRRRQSGWIFRLKEEQQQSKTSAFLTLTYDDQNIHTSENGLPTLNRRDHQLFMKRARKELNKIYWRTIMPNTKLRYYACGEYGNRTRRPHMHSILFNAPQEWLDAPEAITGLWQKGHVRVDKCTDATIAYVTKYMSKTAYTDPFTDIICKQTGEITTDDREKEFSLMSKGLGATWLTDKKVEYYSEKLIPYIIDEGGRKITMPRYFRDKIYTDDDKRIINDKTLRHIEENPQFKSTKHKIDYVQNRFEKQKRMNNAERQTF